MGVAPLDMSGRRWPLVAAAALALYAIVFVLSVTATVPGGGFVSLYVLPVAIVALELGTLAGAAAAMLALGLFVFGAQVEGTDIGLVSFGLRGIVFVSVGLLTGAMAQRLRAAVLAVEFVYPEDRERTVAEVTSELSPVGIAVVGIEGEEKNKIIRVNSKLSEILGRTPKELVGANSFADLAHPDDIPELADAMGRLLAGDVDVLTTEMRVRRPDGEDVWVELTTGIVRDNSGAPLYRLSHILDIGDRKRAEERLRYVADHDLLAGTVNRRRFEADLAKELEEGVGGALLILDVDGFKRVNDTLGHAAGDAVIAQVGTAFTRRLRGNTDVVGRLGGDEFGVLVRRVGADEARRVADDLRVAVRDTLAGDDEEVVRSIRVSIGLAAFAPGAAIDADDLMHVVDLAMYEAKAAGGDRVVSAAAREMTQPRPRL